MKNVQVIDGAENSAYDIYCCSDEIFNLIFPEIGQNIEFIEDVLGRLKKDQIDAVFPSIWDRPLIKSAVNGINGTLFYELYKKKKFYPNKRESDLDKRSRGWNHG